MVRCVATRGVQVHRDPRPPIERGIREPVPTRGDLTGLSSNGSEETLTYFKDRWCDLQLSMISSLARPSSRPTASCLFLAHDDRGWKSKGKNQHVNQYSAPDRVRFLHSGSERSLKKMFTSIHRSGWFALHT